MEFVLARALRGLSSLAACLIAAGPLQSADRSSEYHHSRPLSEDTLVRRRHGKAAALTAYPNP
ncbi:MAG: hypothetical protein ACREMY_11360, partial [bacterium]